MKKGTLFMICGLPGAGKTTLAKKLEIEKKAFRLCPDKWILLLVEDRNNIIERDRLREPIEKLQWEEAQRLLDLGCSIILENGFWPRVERDTYLHKARELGVKVELHFLDIPFEILKERVSNRNNNLDENSIEINMQEMEKWMKLFQAPTDEEGINYDAFVRYQK
jgi:predicted kinase